jgi:hypothetical protein
MSQRNPVHIIHGNKEIMVVYILLLFILLLPVEFVFIYNLRKKKMQRIISWDLFIF